MAVYGDMLAYFPEQFRIVEYFTMTPQNVSSYSKRESLGKVKGVFQYMKRGELVRQEDTLADTDIPTFWTRTKLKVGNFITFDDDDFRIMNGMNRSFEGGYYCYILSTVVGNTDRQEAFEYVDLGQGSYD